MDRTSRSLSLDRKRRSKENWERGKGARKKGNPRYRPVRKDITRDGKRIKTKVYVLRNPEYKRIDLNEQLKIGVKIEQEHTTDKKIAEKIARDHLKEIPDYYTRLAKMEKEAKKEYKG